MTAPQLPSSGPKGKILVIDDELDIREGLFDLLTIEGGYTVELAHNGTEGLRKLDGTAYDVDAVMQAVFDDGYFIRQLAEYRARARRQALERAHVSVRTFEHALRAGCLSTGAERWRDVIAAALFEATRRQC